MSRPDTDAARYRCGIVSIVLPLKEGRESFTPLNLMGRPKTSKLGLLTNKLGPIHEIADVSALKRREELNQHR